MSTPAKSLTEETLEVMKMALERRDEVFAIVDQAANRESAEADLARLFGVNQSLCASVMDLPVRSWLPAWCARLDEELEKHRAIRMQDSAQ
ncbi:hypothetical protein [Glutamicibacter sp.]|uniref:hypothetical protein n=1 Tax=Glutamicibacter sp. TaxID=1931995 RepID=UPI003D6B4869